MLPFPLLVQGERPRHLLLASMRERIGSVLLATQSFWEGVDVPGEALSLVVMDKIPFAVPDDPLTAARIDRIRDEGGEPFGDYQLPRAALALKQGFGRLIRTPRRSRHRRRAGRPRRAQAPTARRCIASLPPDCPRTELAGRRRRVLGRGVRPAPAAARRAASPRHERPAAAPCSASAAYVAGSIPFGCCRRARQGDRPAPGRQRQHRRDQRRARDGQGLGGRRAAGRRRQGLRAGLAGAPTSACRRWRSRGAGVAAIVGHMFTLFLRGRGGKGVATSLGVALALSPVAALIGFGAYVVVFAATRLSSLGSLLGVWTFACCFVAARAAAPPADRAGAGRRRAGDAAPPRKHRAAAEGTREEGVRRLEGPGPRLANS